MSRKLPYFHNNFSGGMTHTPRDTSDLTKVAFMSHLDIYRDKNTAYVMPGYVDDMSIASDADGMKLYNIRAISYLSGEMFCVGTKLDGTGSKLFTKADPTTAEWTATVIGAPREGTDNLAAYTYLAADDGRQRFYWQTVAGGVQYITMFDNTTVTDKHANIGAVNTTSPQVFEKHYTGSVYGTELPTSGISLLGAASATLNNKTTSIFVRDIQSGGEVIGLLGSPSSPRTSRLLIWDSVSLLADQNVNFGKGLPVALGYPANVWVGVINEGLGTDADLTSEANNSATMTVKALAGESAETLYRFYGATATNALTLPTRSVYRDSMLWYARIATNSGATEYKQGVWACGKGDINSPLAVSVLLDTSSLGSVQHVSSAGNHYFFIHNGDSSISRLDSFETGVYDVPATIETLIYGAETPHKKNHNGISITTEDLPSGGSVQVSFRTDVDDAWTSMGTSSTVGTRKHNFTKRSDGTPIGEFQEIQYRIILTGKTAIKNFYVSLTELDDLSFN